jgi:TP901-1 family phage major tail protein
MAKYCGKDFLIQISAGGSPETWTTVAGMRASSMTLNGETVDVTDKDDQPWKTTLAGCGILSMSASMSGHITDSATVATLVNALMNRTATRFKLVSGKADYFTGSFRVTSMERNGEYNGAEQYSVSLEATGTITYTP